MPDETQSPSGSDDTHGRERLGPLIEHPEDERRAFQAPKQDARESYRDRRRLEHEDHVERPASQPPGTEESTRTAASVR